jgi:hypothetical protein
VPCTLTPFSAPRARRHAPLRCSDAVRDVRADTPGLGAPRARGLPAKMPSLFDFRSRVARAPSSSMPFALPRPRLDEPPRAIALSRHGTLDTPGLERDALAGEREFKSGSRVGSSALLPCPVLTAQASPRCPTSCAGSEKHGTFIALGFERDASPLAAIIKKVFLWVFALAYT